MNIYIYIYVNYNELVHNDLKLVFFFLNVIPYMRIFVTYFRDFSLSLTIKFSFSVNIFITEVGFKIVSVDSSLLQV